MRHIYIINKDKDPKADYNGKYLFICFSCRDKNKKWFSTFKILVKIEQIKELQQNHNVSEGHDWILVHESILNN